MKGKIFLFVLVCIVIAGCGAASSTEVKAGEKPLLDSSEILPPPPPPPSETPQGEEWEEVTALEIELDLTGVILEPVSSLEDGGVLNVYDSIPEFTLEEETLYYFFIENTLGNAEISVWGSEDVVFYLIEPLSGYAYRIDDLYEGETEAVGIETNAPYLLIMIAEFDGKETNISVEIKEAIEGDIPLVPLDEA